jgi:hypothetical protein
LGLALTCYFRHLAVVFEKAGIDVMKTNKKEVDRIMRQLAGGEGDCPAVWRQIKKRLAQDEDGFVAELYNAWQNRAVKT